LREFRLFALLVDIGTAVVVIFLAGAGVQWWRSQRVRWWQLHLRDLFGLTALVGVACAWAAARQLENRREGELITALTQKVPQRRSDGNFVDKDVAVSAFLPVKVALPYRRCFQRVVSVQTERDTDLACQFPYLAILKTWELRSDFGTHVTRMPQLEVLDLDSATLHRPDISSDFTVVRDLPPLPNLRIVNFRLTSVEDADLAWLARCPRLEVIVLSFTKVGDDGVRHLCHLKNLHSRHRERSLDRRGMPGVVANWLARKFDHRQQQRSRRRHLCVIAPNESEKAVLANGRLGRVRCQIAGAAPTLQHRLSIENVANAILTRKRLATRVD
jgi:hypothetical protein